MSLLYTNLSASLETSREGFPKRCYYAKVGDDPRASTQWGNLGRSPSLLVST